MHDAFAHCERLVRAGDKDRFLASLFAPADRRGALLALYAFNLEIARVRELAREPLPGEIRLQWWCDVLEGVRGEEASAHPVAAALTETIAKHGLPRAMLLDLIEARMRDLYDDPMPSLADLETYARRTSSALIELAMGVLGGPAAAMTDLAAPAGIAYAITGLLRSFALHASRRQLYVPADILQGHGAGSTDIFAGRATAELRAALAELRTRARRHLAGMRAPLAAAPQHLLPAVLPAAVVRLYLDRMERRDYNPFQSSIDVPQWRRQWRMWRAARRPASISQGLSNP